MPVEAHVAMATLQRDPTGIPQADAASEAVVQAEKMPAQGHKKNVGKEKARQRNRAITLIQKYAGTYAKEGQKTKWIVDLVMKVDEEYKQDLTHQQEQIASLQQQLQVLQESSSQALQQLQEQVQALNMQIQEQELALYNTSYALHTAQAQHAVMQESLHYAEDAAAVATSECQQLAAAVQAMTEQDARARCSLAHRAHHLRDALLQTSAALRQFNDRDRMERNVKELRLREKEKALLAERAALLEQQAAHQARDAALETMQLKYHLAAMKIKELRSATTVSDTSGANGAAGHTPCNNNMFQPAMVVQPHGEVQKAVGSDQEMIRPAGARQQVAAYTGQATGLIAGRKVLP